jgi:hypothetical protein
MGFSPLMNFGAYAFTTAHLQSLRYLCDLQRRFFPQAHGQISPGGKPKNKHSYGLTLPLVSESVWKISSEIGFHLPGCSRKESGVQSQISMQRVRRPRSSTRMGSVAMRAVNTDSNTQSHRQARMRRLRTRKHTQAKSGSYVSLAFPLLQAQVLLGLPRKNGQ